MELRVAAGMLLVWFVMSGGFLKAEYEHKQEVARLELRNEAVEQRFKEFADMKVTVSAYTACREETDDTPNTTALNEKATPGVTVAASRDRAYMLGRKVWIEGVGVREVTDTMNNRWDNRLDILVKDKHTARKWGVKTRRVVVLPKGE